MQSNFTYTFGEQILRSVYRPDMFDNNYIFHHYVLDVVRFDLNAIVPFRDLDTGLKVKG